MLLSVHDNASLTKADDMNNQKTAPEKPERLFCAIIGASTMSLIGLSSKAISSVADADPIAKIIKSRTGNIKNFLPIIIIPK